MPISKEGMNIYEQRPWLNDDIQNRTVLQNNLMSGGTLEITENGTYNVSNYSVAEVNVSGGGSSDFSTAEVTITLRPPESSVYSGEFKVAHIVEENTEHLTTGAYGYDSELSTTCRLLVIVPVGGYASLHMETANDVMFDNITGNAEQYGDFTLHISGNCTAEVVEYEE